MDCPEIDLTLVHMLFLLPSTPPPSQVLRTPAIELGHTFLLGLKYSTPFEATFRSNQGKDVNIEMGCYGIGVSRLIAACAEGGSQCDSGCGIACFIHSFIHSSPVFCRCYFAFNAASHALHYLFSFIHL